MAQVWNWTWLTVAFLAELAALVALAGWGWSAPGSTAFRLLLAIGMPLVAAVLWGLFAAPRAPVRRFALTLAVKIAVPASAAVGLTETGHPRLAVLLVAAAALSALLSTPPEPGAAGLDRTARSQGR